jgi:2-polyprenyl-6-hydroxyphenyl methylase/3-demethylubiquinone-9 3-methyltransferase
MASDKRGKVNNEIYHSYGERWYEAADDPVALLRAEGRARNPWIVSEIRRRLPAGNVRVLDIGCGAGFLANHLAQQGFDVTGIDTSEQSLEVARRYDSTGSVDYRSGDACRLEFEDGTFEVACALDFLEHVEDPTRVLREASRVLKAQGLFFFHTFNRNLLSWLVIIKGVEWFVRNTPRDMHSLRYFIKPAELSRMCGECGLEVVLCRGFMPKIARTAFWKMLATGRVSDDFTFGFTHSTLMGYTGLAVRDRPPRESSSGPDLLQMDGCKNRGTANRAPSPPD